MSALPKYDAYPEYFPEQRSHLRNQPTARRHQPEQQQAAPAVETTVETLVTPVMPPLVVGLEQLKRLSTFVAGACVLALVPAYGVVVSTQSQWGQAHEQLQGLERQEQRLINERAQVRSEIVEQAQQKRHLIPQRPAASIFLQPAPARRVVPPVARPATLPINTIKPLSY